MLREETLKEVGKRLYEEPDGEIIEVVSIGKNTMTVITRVDESEKGRDRPDLLFKPSTKTVSELRGLLDDETYNDRELAALLAAEKDGKNRKTAIDAINDLQ